MEKIKKIKRPKLAVTSLDRQIAELMKKTDHKILAIWACDCAERALPYFEKIFPNDDRPRKAIEACRKWVQTGIFRMTDVRKSSLAAHEAAREAEEANSARSAARSAGQAMATAHVSTHAIAAAVYAATAVRDSIDLTNLSTIDTTIADAATLKEREWQYKHLLELKS